MRPAVSVGFGLGFSSLSPVGGDACLSHFIQPHSPVDEKITLLDDLFDFDHFPQEGSPASGLEDPFGLGDTLVDVNGSSLFNLSPHSNPYGFPDGFDAKYSDMQSASGATYVSDEALAADLLH